MPELPEWEKYIKFNKKVTWENEEHQWGHYDKGQFISVRAVVNKDINIPKLLEEGTIVWCDKYGRKPGIHDGKYVKILESIFINITGETKSEMIKTYRLGDVKKVIEVASLGEPIEKEAQRFVAGNDAIWCDKKGNKQKENKEGKDGYIRFVKNTYPYLYKEEQYKIKEMIVGHFYTIDDFETITDFKVEGSLDSGVVAYCDEQGEIIEDAAKDEHLAETSIEKKGNHQHPTDGNSKSNVQVSVKKPAGKESKRSVNRDDIETFHKMINRNDKNHKFQVFKPGHKTITPINITSADELIKQCKKFTLQGISCISTNPTLPDKQKTDSVTDIENLYYDADVNKDRKVNGISTPDDKKIVIDTAYEIVKYLSEEKNLQPSLLGDSGNGGHIAIPVNISLKGFFTGKTEKENKEIWDQSEIKGRMLTLQKELQKKFGSDIVEIDCISADIIRRVKISGTWNIKDDMIPEEHRQAKILEAYPENIEPLIVEGNTTVFNAIEPYKERPEEPITSDKEVTTDFAKLLKRDKKINDLFNGNWKKEPYNLKSDGAPKEKWTRSEAEHMLLCQLIWYDLTKEQIFSIMDKSKIGKWKDATDAYKIHQYKSAMNYINTHGGTKTTSKRISIKNGDRRVATLQIMGKNGFCINSNDGRVIFPPTETQTPWPTSTHYRNLITKALTKNCKLIESEADEVVNALCVEADKRIKWLKRRGAFSQSLDDEKQGILDKITKVSITRSVDNNVYNLHLDGEIIKLTDKEFYDGPYHFCIGYFNRFLKKIIISKEEWDEKFIPHLLSDEIIDTEDEKIDSNLDVVSGKFLQHIKNKTVYNWEDTEKRTAYKNSLYLDINTNIVLICSDLIRDFFERFKVPITYKTTIQEFNSFLRLEKDLLIRDRSQQRVGDKERKSFWRFDAEKLGISEDNIAKEEPLEQNATDKDILKIDDFEEGDEHE